MNVRFEAPGVAAPVKEGGIVVIAEFIATNDGDWAAAGNKIGVVIAEASVATNGDCMTRAILLKSNSV